MILVDTSMWIDHFRSTLPALVRLLEDGEVILTGLERPAGRRSASKRHLHCT